ncbi:uracil-DNA glycosylase family protein [uncultured Methanocorpusculum sp.]|nr:uracil-DNA glycosylase family protein [uncultured Methanocorpusculum sp.]
MIPQSPEKTVDPSSVYVVMISEVVPEDPRQDFYGGAEASYAESAVALFRQAGVDVSSVLELLDRGIYLTNAVKYPKTGYTVETSAIEQSLPLLEEELARFPNLRVVMLMGDVAKKSFNMLAKKQTGKNCIPSGATYKLRAGEFYFGSVRVIPSYIMTGGNLLIEKSKTQMITEDIKKMMGIILP